jgi:hypothetical protein
VDVERLKKLFLFSFLFIVSYKFLFIYHNVFTQVGSSFIKRVIVVVL